MLKGHQERIKSDNSAIVEVIDQVEKSIKKQRHLLFKCDIKVTEKLAILFLGQWLHAMASINKLSTTTN